MSYIDQFPEQCGIDIICGLSSKEPLKHQIYQLSRALENVSMVLISDTIDSTAWKETKEIANRGPVRINPNSGNKIAYWTILPSHLEKLRELLPVKDRGKVEPRKSNRAKAIENGNYDSPQF